jgi:glyoxylase-like metal-dependent hydrolase (beta-lactamase superfamily II)
MSMRSSMSESCPVHTEIAPRVHLVRGKNRAKFPEANSLLIDEKPLTLVDAGSSMEHLYKTLSDIGHSLTDIEQIVLTHCHIDHKGHAATIQEQSDCDIICHPLAKKGVETLGGLVDEYGIAEHPLYDVWREYIDSIMPYVVADCTVTDTFSDKETIVVGDTQLIPIYAPGHTHDHTIIGINGLETILLVDIDLTNFGPWYGNVVSNIADFRKSLSNVIALEPKVGISSHLIEPVEDGLIERLVRYSEVFEAREEKIIKSIREGLNTIDKLASVPTVYPRLPYPPYLIFEEYMLLKHVEDMNDRGIIKYDGKTIYLK